MKPIDYLQLAVDESLLSIQSGSSPFGAVIVKDDKIIARAHNMVVPQNDPTAHAEVECIRKACQAIESFDLKGCVLYTSCEPCPMCLNAAKWANIDTIYYAATRDDADAIGFRDRVFYNENTVHMAHIDLKSARQVMEQWYADENKKCY